MAVEVKIPKVGESVATVFISRWLVAPGEPVSAGQPILAIDSDKASMEVPAPASGRLASVSVAEGDEVPVEAVVGLIAEGDAAPAPQPSTAQATPEPPAPPAAVQAGPAARQAAVQAGVDLGAVEGTGTRGRILSRDVRAAAEALSSAVASAGVASPAPVAQRAPSTPPSGGVVPPHAADPRVEVVPMSPLRRTIARRLVEAQQTAAMLTTFNEVDCHNLMELRRRYQDRFVERYGIKLGVMSFFVRAVVEALKEIPAVNAEISGDTILYKRYYNIGVAVSSPRGLVVPVLRDAERLGFAQTEKAIAELATRARDNKLTLDDFKDGTFTVSNGGVFGSLMSTPILNPPQVGILGMHAIVDRPVGINGQVVLRPMMYIALSYDHRIIDGREAVTFLKRVKELVEAPERVLLEV